MGADAEGGGLGPRAEAAEGNARPSHTRSQPWKDVVRSMFAAAQQSMRACACAVWACSHVWARARMVKQWVSGAQAGA